jgi:hypothetical protein
MKDEHGWPFQDDWQLRQQEPLPEMTKPKESLKIGINDVLSFCERPQDGQESATSNIDIRTRKL